MTTVIASSRDSIWSAVLWLLFILLFVAKYPVFNQYFVLFSLKRIHFVIYLFKFTRFFLFCFICVWILSYRSDITTLTKIYYGNHSFHQNTIVAIVKSSLFCPSNNNLLIWLKLWLLWCIFYFIFSCGSWSESEKAPSLIWLPILCITALKTRSTLMDHRSSWSSASFEGLSEPDTLL